MHVELTQKENKLMTSISLVVDLDFLAVEFTFCKQYKKMTFFKLFQYRNFKKNYKHTPQIYISLIKLHSSHKTTNHYITA